MPGSGSGLPVVPSVARHSAPPMTPVVVVFVIVFLEVWRSVAAGERHESICPVAVDVVPRSVLPKPRGPRPMSICGSGAGASRRWRSPSHRNRRTQTRSGPRQSHPSCCACVRQSLGLSPVTCRLAEPAVFQEQVLPVAVMRPVVIQPIRVPLPRATPPATAYSG